MGSFLWTCSQPSRQQNCHRNDYSCLTFPGGSTRAVPVSHLVLNAEPSAWHTRSNVQHGPGRHLLRPASPTPHRWRCLAMATDASLQSPRAQLHFLKASHFALGPDPQLHVGATDSTTHRDFPAHTDVPRAQPCPPPPRGTLFQQDPRWARKGLVSEAQCAFVSPPTHSREQARAQGARSFVMQTGHLHLQEDAHGRALFSTAHADYGWPELQGRDSEQNPGARLIFHRDSMPSGDRHKLRIPPTTYQALFPPYEAACLQPRASCEHLGEQSPGSLRYLLNPEVLKAVGDSAPSPRGHLATSGDRFGCHNWVSGC